MAGSSLMGCGTSAAVADVGTSSQNSNFGIKSRLSNQPPFPCLNCNKKFRRLHEWTRHGYEVHHPEFRQLCPHPNCGLSFSRSYRLNQHHQEKHGASLTTLQTRTTLQDIDKQRIWGCGFCIQYNTDWKDFAKHVWSHFQAGKVKQDWNTSMCIHSLLHYPSIRADWQSVIRQYTGEKSDNAELRWSDENIKLLGEDLQWDHAGRQSGFVLASKAFNLSAAINPHIPPVHNSSFSGFPGQDQPSLSSMSFELAGFALATSFHATEDQSLPFPIDGSAGQHSSPAQLDNALRSANSASTPIPYVAPTTNSTIGSGNPLTKAELDGGLGDLEWCDSMLASNLLDSGLEYKNYEWEDTFDWQENL